MENDILAPFYEYLEVRRQALLTELDKIERLMGVSPRTAIIRKLYNKSKIINTSTIDTLSGVIKYQEGD